MLNKRPVYTKTVPFSVSLCFDIAILMSLQKITFSGSRNQDFYKELRARVNTYFRENDISRYANTNMIFKTIFMLLLYLVPFVLMMTLFESTWAVMLMWILMGFGLAGIGLSIMHDANHSAYSRHSWVNKWLGHLMLLLGGSDVNWRIQHNVLHHTYTNVSGMDEDIDSGVLMRFAPQQKRRWAHRFQFLYAWFLYGFMTIMWVSSKDYVQYARYKKRDLFKTQGLSNRRALVNLILAKAGYFAVFLVLPIIFSPVSWWVTILFFLMMHFIGGLTLALIFQPAHVVPVSGFPEPDSGGNIEESWAVSQLLNTANFAPRSRVFSWYVGGLNYQIEHHLFPNVCHVHYRKIATIVRDTAFEYNLPYYSYKTFAGALFAHMKLLYKLGKRESVLQEVHAH